MPIVYDNEALDLRERTLDDEPQPRNGPVVMQPVSEQDVSTTFLKESTSSADMDRNKNAASTDVQRRSEPVTKKPQTATVVFSASAIADQSDVEADDDPDYDSIRPTSILTGPADNNQRKPVSFINSTYRNGEAEKSPQHSTTEVKRRLSDMEQVGEDDPYYSTADVNINRLRSNTDSSAESGDSHDYSNPDRSVFHQNARDTEQLNRDQDEMDNYAAIGKLYLFRVHPIYYIAYIDTCTYFS